MVEPSSRCPDRTKRPAPQEFPEEATASPVRAGQPLPPSRELLNDRTGFGTADSPLEDSGSARPPKWGRKIPEFLTRPPEIVGGARRKWLYARELWPESRSIVGSHLFGPNLWGASPDAPHRLGGTRLAIAGWDLRSQGVLGAMAIGHQCGPPQRQATPPQGISPRLPLGRCLSQSACFEIVPRCRRDNAWAVWSRCLSTRQATAIRKSTADSEVCGGTNRPSSDFFSPTCTPHAPLSVTGQEQHPPLPGITSTPR
jgi:hypothetical protein